MPPAFARRKKADAYSVPETFPQKFFVLFFVAASPCRVFHEVPDRCRSNNRDSWRTQVAVGSWAWRFEGSSYRPEGRAEGRNKTLTDSKLRSEDWKWRSSGTRVLDALKPVMVGHKAVVGRLKALIVAVEDVSDRPKPRTEAQEDRRSVRRTSLPVGSLV